MTLRSGKGTVPLPPALVKHQWKPGQSGNPGGLGGEYRRCLKLCREASFAAAQEIIHLAKHSDDDRIRLMAATWIYERAWGKPREYDPSQEQVDGPPINLAALTPAERDRFMALLRKARAPAQRAASEPPTIGALQGEDSDGGQSG
jgi:hypothetical protein